MSELKYNFKCPNERYEYVASLFYDRYGFVAPGKDDPLETIERMEKNFRWSAFIEEYYAEAAQAHFELNLKKENK